MKEGKFNVLYRKLNAEQKAAVDAIDGPVMVIAGPGTGKTQILTLRIANILRTTDTSPDSILALTFTEAAAANMRKRLVATIGSAGYQVNISTFHGFCNKIIQEYAERFPRIIGYNNASQVDQIDLIRSVLESRSFTYLKPFGDHFFHVSNIVGGIRDLKKEGISVAHFKEIIAQEKEALLARDDLYHTKGAHKGKMKSEAQKEQKILEKNEELAYFYEVYERELAERKLYDFEDMLLAVIGELEHNKDFLLELQEKYQYILVDEHQDTNGAQNKILELLASFFPNPNLFVVGDEKQAIFRFQGASLANFLYFKDTFQGVRLVSLVHNYRSTQSILDASQSLIEHNAIKPLSSPLRAAGKGPARPANDSVAGGSPIDIYSFNTEEGERLFITERVAMLIAEGVPADEIAVLYRNNSDAFPIAEDLERAGVPFVVESDRDILGDVDIRKFNTLITAIGTFGNDEALVKAFHIDFLAINPLVVYRALGAAKEARMSLHAFLDIAAASKGKKKTKDPLVALYGKIRAWKTLSHNTDFLNFFTTVARESGLINHLIAHPHRVEKLDKIGALYDEIAHIVEHHSDYSITEYLYYLEVLERHGVMIKARSRRMGSSVRLMTAHKAKGLEFEHVFVIGVYDGHWGNKRSMATFRLPTRIKTIDTEGERNEDERRLFYMALTRAKTHVIATYARHGADGKERVPSQFVGEIHEELRVEHDGEEYDARVKKEARFMPRAEGEITDVAAFLKERFVEQGLSPTALNNYLTCPWRYYFNSLVRIPLAPGYHQTYGIIMHKVLEEFFNARSPLYVEKHADAPGSGEEAGADFMEKRFIYHLDRRPINERLYEDLKKKGIETLRAYHEAGHQTWNYNTVNEYYIKGIEVGGVKLTGKLDKLELELDGEHVLVVDYKTKKPQSRNWIEGATASADGNFKRQLVFYKLLLDEMPHGRYVMRAGAIDFVEPDEKGRFKREVFEITDEEVIALKTEIARVAEEISTMAFWDTRCGDKDCEYCPLRDMMRG